MSERRMLLQYPKFTHYKQLNQIDWFANSNTKKLYSSILLTRGSWRLLQQPPVWALPGQLATHTLVDALYHCHNKVDSGFIDYDAVLDHVDYNLVLWFWVCRTSLWTLLLAVMLTDWWQRVNIADVFSECQLMGAGMAQDCNSGCSPSWYLMTVWSKPLKHS